MMTWMMSSLLWGVALSDGKAAQAGIRTCLSAASIAGIDFSDDCKAMSLGHALPDAERFKLSTARQVAVVIAQYNTGFAVAHAPQTVNGLLAVRYDSHLTPMAASTVRVQCPTAFSPAGQLGCSIATLSKPRLASR